MLIFQDQPDWSLVNLIVKCPVERPWQDIKTKNQMTSSIQSLQAGFCRMTKQGSENERQWWGCEVIRKRKGVLWSYNSCTKRGGLQRIRHTQSMFQSLSLQYFSSTPAYIVWQVDRRQIHLFCNRHHMLCRLCGPFIRAAEHMHVRTSTIWYTRLCLCHWEQC